jgi:hypothetical protein
MSSCLSGLLAHLFLSHIENQIVPTLDATSYYCDVDDGFMLTSNETNATAILDRFNNGLVYLQLDIEEPETTACSHTYPPPTHTLASCLYYIWQVFTYFVHLIIHYFVLKKTRLVASNIL